MITGKDLKSYELDSIVEYYDMIISSRENGHTEQVIEQFKALSKEQRKEFLHYLATGIKHTEADCLYRRILEETQKICIDNIYC